MRWLGCHRPDSRFSWPFYTHVLYNRAMGDPEKEIIELLTSYADALSEVAEFATVYVTEPSYWLHGKVGLIRLEAWTSECLSTEKELSDELHKLYDEGEEDEADEVLYNAYIDLAWKDAEEWARAVEGKLLEVHWTEESTLSQMRAAYLIVIDAEKFYQHHLPEPRGEAEGDVQP